jgi:hypothetical protein
MIAQMHCQSQKSKMAPESMSPKVPLLADFLPVPL